ncbi:hypothetical protein CSB37_00485 [bacterium DOLZORAL124_38_8]|nr:MAG: hypothetical protein CSB37_00485 [bacterium DOLZORAL124_38_8]
MLSDSKQVGVTGEGRPRIKYGELLTIKQFSELDSESSNSHKKDGNEKVLQKSGRYFDSRTLAQ